MGVEPLAYDMESVGQFRVSQKVLVTGLVVLNCQIGAGHEPDAKGKGGQCCLHLTCLGEAQKQRIQSPGTECRRESHIPALQGVALHGREKVS